MKDSKTDSQIEHHTVNQQKFRMYCIIVGALLVCLVVLLILFTGSKKRKMPIVGVVLSGAATDEGWNRMNYEGVKAAAETMGMRLIVKEHVAEFSGQCETAVEELLSQHAELILLTSFSYADEISDLVDQHPDISFYANSFDSEKPNLSSYFGRMYQARYLAGIVAGMQTETNRIGYVAAMSNSEVNRGINAFTLGVRSVNPDAQVIVNWTGIWEDEAVERKAAKELINNAGVDLLAYHQNQSYVVDEAEKAGIYSIGYNQGIEGLSEKYLTAAVWNWQPIFEEIMREYQQGKGNHQSNLWLGMDKGAIGLYDYSSAVSSETKQAVSNAVERIQSGQDVFSGMIYDTNDRIRCQQDEAISDTNLLEHMDWFVRGVSFYEK